MTREEAIKQIEKLKSYCEYMGDSDESGAYLFDLDGQALDLALSALRPITREQVEKARGEWRSVHGLSEYYCSRCGEEFEIHSYDKDKYRFCPYCMTPMTDKAVYMVMERLEALHSETKTD